MTTTKTPFPQRKGVSFFTKRRWHLAVGTWHLTRGTWHLALGTWLAALCTLHLAPCIAQVPDPGTIPWTPVETSGLVRATIEVPAKFSSINLNPNLHVLNLPPGWTGKIFAYGNPLSRPRFMSWGPDSVLYVANMQAGNVVAMPDGNADGVADSLVIAASGFTVGHDVRFFRDTMFVCSEAGLIKLWRSSGTGMVFDQRITLVNKSAQENQTGGNHRTRTLGLDSNNKKLYISVGSRGNADRETNRALIERYEWDGSGRTTIATGIRNAVGMTIHPRTGKLWANNNGSDGQGRDIPPEWVDIVRENGFYGYPYSYHYQRWFNFTGSEYSDLLPITSADSANVASMKPPAALVAAHCAPMSLTFAHNGMPAPYNKGAFMVMRGSWDRNPPSGAKVIFLEFDSDEDTIANVARDFCTGFVIDTNNVETRWARPVGLALAANGSVYLGTDDPGLKQFIVKLTPPAPSEVNEDANAGIFAFNISPNPTNDVINIYLTRPIAIASVIVVDIQGRVLVNSKMSGTYTSIQVSALPLGTYHVVVSSDKQTVCMPLRIIR